MRPFKNGSLVKSIWRVRIFSELNDCYTDEWFFEKEIDAIHLLAFLHSSKNTTYRGDYQLEHLHMHSCPAFNFTVEVYKTQECA